jgi:predicted secreted protein
MDRQETGGQRPPRSDLTQMRWTSMLAIYVLFWTLSMFLVLPFGVRTSEEEGLAAQPGHAESAPHAFSLPRVLVRAALLGALLTALYVANYVYGWVTVENLDWVN